LPGKIVFTEKTGVNSVILDSVEDVDKAAANLAFSVNLYSGQMCTAPQNIYIPADGINTAAGKISFDDFAQKFTAQITGLVDNPKAGPFVLGAIQNKKTNERVVSGFFSPFFALLTIRFFAPHSDSYRRDLRRSAAGTICAILKPIRENSCDSLFESFGCGRCCTMPLRLCER